MYYGERFNGYTHLAGPSSCSAVWSLAFVGMVQELWVANGARLSLLAIYLLVGWLAIGALVPRVEKLGGTGLPGSRAADWSIACGIVFYLYDERFKHWHGIWHLFVMVGSGTHYAAILLFIA